MKLPVTEKSIQSHRLTIIDRRKFGKPTNKPPEAFPDTADPTGRGTIREELPVEGILFNLDGTGYALEKNASDIAPIKWAFSDCGQYVYILWV